jgi:hypothetical protein
MADKPFKGPTRLRTNSGDIVPREGLGGSRGIIYDQNGKITNKSRKGKFRSRQIENSQYAAYAKQQGWWGSYVPKKTRNQEFQNGINQISWNEDDYDTDANGGSGREEIWNPGKEFTKKEYRGSKRGGGRYRG